MSWEGSMFNTVYSLASGDTTPDEERYRQYDLTEHLSHPQWSATFSGYRPGR